MRKLCLNSNHQHWPHNPSDKAINWGKLKAISDLATSYFCHKFQYCIAGKSVTKKSPLRRGPSIGKHSCICLKKTPEYRLLWRLFKGIKICSGVSIYLDDSLAQLFSNIRAITAKGLRPPTRQGPGNPEELQLCFVQGEAYCTRKPHPKRGDEDSLCSKLLMKHT